MSNRRSVNVSAEAEMIAEAKTLGLNLSRTFEEAVRNGIRQEKARRWREENAEAIAFNNAQVEREGLWCDEYRLF
jgi:antitoxin CcdA